MGDLYTQLARRYEKACAFRGAGSVTLLAVTTMPGDDVTHPVPDNTVFITFPAISTQAVTAGLTWDVAGFPIDVSYVYALENEIYGCDHNHLLGAEYNASRTTMNQNVFTVGTVVNF